MRQAGVAQTTGMLRKLLSQLHLTTGFLTGVALTYQKQTTEWPDEAGAGSTLSVDEPVSRVAEDYPDSLPQTQSVYRLRRVGFRWGRKAPAGHAVGSCPSGGAGSRWCPRGRDQEIESKNRSMRRRMAVSGRRPCAACMLSTKCDRRRVPGMTQVTSG